MNIEERIKKAVDNSVDENEYVNYQDVIENTTIVAKEYAEEMCGKTREKISRLENEIEELNQRFADWGDERTIEKD